MKIIALTIMLTLCACAAERGPTTVSSESGGGANTPGSGGNVSNNPSGVGTPSSAAQTAQ